MATVCVQIQPDRAPTLDVGRLRTICEVLAENEPCIARFGLVEGIDGGPYLNLMFETTTPAELWRLLQSAFYQGSEFAIAMAEASMAVCTGARGWEDYLLLYHYDNSVQCNGL